MSGLLSPLNKIDTSKESVGKKHYFWATIYKLVSLTALILSENTEQNKQQEQAPSPQNNRGPVELQASTEEANSPVALLLNIIEHQLTVSLRICPANYCSFEL